MQANITLYVHSLTYNTLCTLSYIQHYSMYTFLHTTLYVLSLTYNTTLCTLSYIQHSVYSLLHTTLLYVHSLTYNTLCTLSYIQHSMYTLLHTTLCVHYLTYICPHKTSFGDLTYLMRVSSMNSYEGQHINQDNEPPQLM